MPPKTLVLAFDTSAAHCAAALLCGEEVLSTAREDMAKGQAERLFPLLEEMLAGAGHGWQDLHVIGVCTGPGNFTGVRIAVASARGLALSLEIPAIGVTMLEALAYEQKGRSASLVDARRERFFCQIFQDGAATSEPELIARDDLPARLAGVAQINRAAPLPATALCGIPSHARAAPVIAVARIARQQLGQENPRPAPLYLRPANAALPADPPPVILP